jgi:hypothetical protein
VAYGPFNNTDSVSKRRRRVLVDQSAYEVGDILLYFSNTCGDTRARGIWSFSLTSQNSSCVTQRLNQCKSFITSPTPNLQGTSNLWSPFPTGFTQLIRNNFTSCTPISISKIYNVPISQYYIAGNRSNTTSFVTNVGK